MRLPSRPSRRPVPPRSFAAVLVAVALMLVGCSSDRDDDDGATRTGDDASAGAELVFLGEGSDSQPDGPPLVLDVDGDPTPFAERFLDGDTDALDDALADVDLDGRTLVGGVAHTGCFLAGSAALETDDDDALAVVGTDLDPDEDSVECVRAVVTVALFAIHPNDLVAGVTSTAPIEHEVPSTLLVLEADVGDRATSTPGPGVARTREQGQALLGRLGLDPNDEEVLAHLDDGTEVLVTGVVGHGCNAPTGATLVPATGGGLEVVGVVPPDEEGVVCEAYATAGAVLAVAAADVPPGTEVGGQPDDSPTGVGTVHAVVPVAAEAEAVAVAVQTPLLADALAAIPGAPALADLGLPAADPPQAERLVFVVDACAADRAELVADIDADAVTAVAFSAADPGVDCDAPGRYLVVADLDPALADDLEPVTQLPG